MLVHLQRNFFFKGRRYRKGIQNIEGIKKELLPRDAKEVELEPAMQPKESKDSKAESKK